MVEMVSLVDMDMMDCLVLKDPKDLKENLVQQMVLQDLKASQELGEQLDHKDHLLDQLDQGVEADLHQVGKEFLPKHYRN